MRLTFGLKSALVIRKLVQKRYLLILQGTLEYSNGSVHGGINKILIICVNEWKKHNWLYSPFGSSAS